MQRSSFLRYLDLEQRLRLFEAGVDDCVSEPFFTSELGVRLGLSIRLHQADSDLSSSNTVDVLRSGDLELDLVRRRATRLGKPIDLRPKEFLLLEYLVRNVNRPLTRTMILEHVWKSSFEGLTNVVDVYISSLRSKVDRDFPQKLIQTNRGIGYTFTCVSDCPATPGQVRHLGLAATGAGVALLAQSVVPADSARWSDTRSHDAQLCKSRGQMRVGADPTVRSAAAMRSKPSTSVNQYLNCCATRRWSNG